MTIHSPSDTSLSKVTPFQQPGDVQGGAKLLIRQPDFNPHTKLIKYSFLNFEVKFKFMTLHINYRNFNFGILKMNNVDV